MGTFTAGHGITLFAESRPYEVTRHRPPAWKLVLPAGGHVTVGADAGAGVLVPPRFEHGCGTSSGFVAVFLEPWRVPGAANAVRPVWLDAARTRRMRDALGPQLDGAALRAELAAFAGPPTAVDARVRHAVRACGGAARLDAVAADVGLSPARLRTLVRTEVGIPLGTLRQWERLRTAIGSLVEGGTGIAEAATAAGFADQAHLTRTVRKLVGRTPGSLRRGGLDPHAASGCRLQPDERRGP
ncbi:helix-turn-helix domain-containing protein [Streptomyces sp. NPDC050844]|uniref:helix-turn-helix domain-containing protein n=1 Tax=Streptomyces sp. NPDC050844 TaxID=3155790 RepID=UPI0033F41215